jgi:hypothetical protein
MTTGDAVGGQPPVRDISALAVWIICGLLFVGFIVMVFVAPEILRGRGIDTEYGLVEQGQNVVLLISLLLGIDTLLRAETRWMRIWLAVVVVGLIYLLGEETSWGQHYFGWSAGGIFESINDQGETNFHNTGDGWLDQKPRAVLLLGMILGTIVHPLMKHYRKGRGLFDNPWWIAPTLASLAPVVLSQLAALPKRIEKLQMLPYSLNLYRWSEAEEFFMYLFFITYLLSLRTRLVQRKKLGVTDAG